MKRFLTLVFACLLLLGCSRQMELMGSIAEADANDILAALQNEGIDAEKQSGKEGKVSVLIHSDDIARAVDLLRAKGLPPERHAGIGQVFKKDGLISSPIEERARYLYAISQELAATLSQIDGVTVARVHLVLPERSSVGEPIAPSSASVFIKYQDGYNLEILQPQIRRLINNGVPGLTPEKISIVLIGAQATQKKDPPLSSSRLIARITFVLVGFLALIGAFVAARHYLPIIKARRNQEEGKLDLA